MFLNPLDRHGQYEFRQTRHVTSTFIFLIPIGDSCLAITWKIECE
jgi:hypothetical protein